MTEQEKRELWRKTRGKALNKCLKTITYYEMTGFLHPITYWKSPAHKYWYLEMEDLYGDD
jgi:hypothetical protein